MTSDVYYKVEGDGAAATSDRPGSTHNPDPNPNPNPTPSDSEPYLDSKDEISVFFETSGSETPYVWVWDSSNNYNANSTWPGDAMTLQCTLPSGAKVWKWTYTGTLTAIPTGIIFTHDGGNKYNGTDGTFTNHGYYTASSPLNSTKEITKVKSTATGISGVTKTVAHSCRIYNLRGECVAVVGSLNDAEYTLRSGIYVCNGKKFVVR